MEETAYVQKITTDLAFAAQESTPLKLKPKALRQLLAYSEVANKLIDDPVFFAVLMCGDSWLVSAPDPQEP